MRIICVVAASVAALTAAAGAHACINIHIAPSVGTAGPGDAVAFSISGVVEGARYTVSVGGHEIAAGTATGDTISGSFTMPDLGTKSLATEITAMIAHEDLEQSPWPTSAPLSYRAAAPPAPAATAAAPKTQTKPAPPAVPAKKDQPAPRPQATRPKTRPQPTVRTARVPAPATAPAARPTPEPVTPSARAVVAPRARAHKTRPQVALQGARAHTPANAPRDLDRPRSVPRVVVVNVVPSGHTPLPLAALLLLLAGVPPAAAYLVRRRRRQPEPLDEVELELQEMIAEERARRRERV